MRSSRAPRASAVSTSSAPPKSSAPTPSAHLQSGIYFGYIGLVDGIIERIIAEFGPRRTAAAHRRQRRPGAHDRRRIRATSRRSTTCSPSRACAFSSSAIAPPAPAAARCRSKPRHTSPVPAVSAARKLSAVSLSALRSSGNIVAQSPATASAPTLQPPLRAPRPTIAPSIRFQTRPAHSTRQ